MRRIISPIKSMTRSNCNDYTGIGCSSGVVVVNFLLNLWQASQEDI